MTNLFTRHFCDATECAPTARDRVGAETNPGRARFILLYAARRFFFCSPALHSAAGHPLSSRRMNEK
jgi:hypothetical protein